MRIWRISKAKYAHSAFSGEGARLFDARWSFAGTPMVYTSSSLALAAIEFFVQLDPSEAPAGLISVSAEVPDEPAAERVEIWQLPRDWRKTDHKTVQKLGTDWARSQRSAALIVPSAAVEGEWNVLLNPGHPDFKEVKIDEPRPFRYDERMFR
jgi:RES domain-containing protein